MQMKTVSIFFESVTVKMNTGPDICDITPELNRLIEKWNVENGTLIATMIGSTGSLTSIEIESGALTDLKNAIVRLAPRHWSMNMNRHGMMGMGTVMFRRHCSDLPLLCRSEAVGSGWVHGSRWLQSTMITAPGPERLR